MSSSVATHAHLVPGETYHFGEPAPLSAEYLFSNDGPIPDEALTSLRGRDNGISLHIGDGGLVSLLPLHQLHPIQVDRNPAVITMNKLIIESIVKSATVAEARERIITVGSGLLKTLPRPQESAKNMADNLSADASRYRLGKLHWSNHFHEVQEALHERPPVHVVADIRNSDFAVALKNMSEQFGDIKLFNATNVHSYLSHDGMDFLQNLPFAEDVTVLASMSGEYTDFIRGNSQLYSLERMTMQGVANYIKFVDLIRFNPAVLVRHLI